MAIFPETRVHPFTELFSKELEDLINANPAIGYVWFPYEKNNVICIQTYNKDDRQRSFCFMFEVKDVAAFTESLEKVIPVITDMTKTPEEILAALKEAKIKITSVPAKSLRILTKISHEVVLFTTKTGNIYKNNCYFPKTILAPCCTEVSDLAYNCVGMLYLYIPKSVKKIGENALQFKLLSNALTEVVYEGSKEEFDALYPPSDTQVAYQDFLKQAKLTCLG